MIIIKLLSMFVGTYYFSAIVQTVLHRIFGHHDRIHRVYVTHAEGHHSQYPPHQLLTDQWIGSEKHVMWYYGLFFAPIAFLVYVLFGAGMALCHGVSLAFSVWWHIYLHEQYHVKGSWWERFAWFKTKRRLHFIHHCEEHRNYAIVEYWVDSLLGTRKD